MSALEPIDAGPYIAVDYIHTITTNHDGQKGKKKEKLDVFIPYLRL
jgi:hypothetical protein